MRLLVKVSLAAACLFIACQDETSTPVSAGRPSTVVEGTDSIGFTDVIDLTVGVQLFRNVDVVGTLSFFITPADDSTRSDVNPGARPYDVFIHTEMRFRRSQDYTMDQSWSAGGKSGERLVLGPGSKVAVQKFYRIWSIPNEAYINITYLVSTSRVDVHALWVSYEPPPDA